MSLFSFLRKNKQEPASSDSEFHSRAEEESDAIRGRSRRKTTKPGRQNKSENQPIDPVLPEKKRARRRLVGAVALVLAVIIGLPMVLDSEPKPLAEDISIQIPSKDKPYVTPGTSKKAPASANPNVAASAALDAREEIVEAPVAVMQPPSDALAPPVAIPPKPPVKPVDNAKAPVPVKVVPKAEPKPVIARATEKDADKAAEKAAEEAAEKAAEKADEAARAKAILEARTDVRADQSAADAKPLRFIVQVAALASADKVSELQDKLKVAGIRSYTQKITTSSGDRIRIRVGPFASKDDADKTKTRLNAIGLNGTVVPLKP